MNGESDVKGKGRLGSTLLNVIQYTGVGQSTVCVCDNSEFENE